MIVQVITVPAFLIQGGLPFFYYGFKLRQVKVLPAPISFTALVDIHMLEMEHHVQFVTVLPAVEQRFIGCYPRRFTDGHYIPPREYLPVHLPQVFMHTRAVYEIGLPRSEAVRAGTRGRRHRGEPPVFADQVDDIHAKPVNPFVEPEPHNIMDFPAD